MAQTIQISGSRGGTIEIAGGSGQHAAIKITESGGGTIPGYEGPYEFTPTQETQTAQIGGKRATQDITIHPIPQNYGLVTYSGNIITIS